MFFIVVPPGRELQQARCRPEVRDSWQVVENRREPAPDLTWCRRNRAGV